MPGLCLIKENIQMWNVLWNDLTTRIRNLHSWKQFKIVIHNQVLTALTANVEAATYGKNDWSFTYVLQPIYKILYFNMVDIVILFYSSSYIVSQCLYLGFYLIMRSCG